MTVRRFTLFYTLFPLLILLASVQLSSAQEVVLYPSQAPVRVGNWSVVGDSTAAGGARIASTDHGASKISAPASNPSNYFEMSFNASSGKQGWGSAGVNRAWRRFFWLGLDAGVFQPAAPLLRL